MLFRSVGAASAQDAAAFYKGKQFKFISTSGAGGGYDAYSRLLSRHIANHIPGNPSLVFENMPGASGMRGTNYMYNIAPRDGSVMAGTYCARLVVERLSIASFQYLLDIVMLVSGLTLLWSALRTLQFS